MSTRAILWAIVAIVIIILGVTAFQQDAEAPEADTIQQEQNGQQPAATTTGAEENTNKNETSNGDGTGTGAATKTTTVRYTDQGFRPEAARITSGTAVTFINETDTRMWVASDEHPTHTNYHGTTLSEHCPDTSNTAFDQCGAGDEYTFTFEKNGEWEYHNHLAPNHGGTIIVE